MKEEAKENSGSEQPKKKHINGTKLLRAMFGIIMIIIYFGMGYLMLANFFEVPRYVSLTLGIVFIVYGIFRGYRQYKGIDYTFRSDED